jgi:nucleoside-diphosphate-sugar epimerase
MIQDARPVLVTGGTGLIGGESIATLLERGWNVRAVARGSDAAEAERRIRERLARSGRREPWDGRLSCHAGSVTATDFGLRPAAFDGLRAILHCAGETAFNEDEKCWATNVGAAERLVELARSLKNPPRIYFVSTASVCMGPRHSEISEDTPFGGYENGYTRSKRKAEVVLLESGLDVVILRPTIVFSRGVQDRKMARAMLWVIPALMELGEAPVEPGDRIDIIPVDFAADAIERFLRIPKPRHRRYHVSAGRAGSATCAEFQETVAEVDPRAKQIAMGAREGRSPKRAQDQLRRRLEEAISHYVPFMSADVVYSCDRLRAEVGPELGPCPKVTEYVDGLLGQFEYQEGIEESARP